MAINEADFPNLSAVAAVAAMRNGDMSAENYARALLDRAETLEELNAFRTLDRDMVLEAARGADKQRAAGTALGALHGLPIPVKDSVNTKALPTSNGTRALRDFRPKDDAEILKRLFAEGALLMGKTNLHELSFGWTSNNMTFGPVRNPYDPTRIPGGSSGGSAVVVAARIAPLAVGEDTHGSIRVPAAMCGVAGLRPTHGRYPGKGILSLTMNKFDQPGPLARSVADLALFDSVVTGDHSPISAAPLTGVRIGISPDYFFDGLDPEVERITTNALGKLQAAGATLVRAEVPAQIQDGLAISMTIICYELVASMSAFLAEEAAGITFDDVLARISPNVDQTLKTAVLPPNAVSSEAYEHALRQRHDLNAAVTRYFKANEIDAVLFPPVLCPAPPLGDNREIEIRGEKVAIRTAIGRNTALGPCASTSCLVLPAGLTSAGLPVGIELDALPGCDRRLLSLGLSFEKAFGAIRAPTLDTLIKKA